MTTLFRFGRPQVMWESNPPSGGEPPPPEPPPSPGPKMVPESDLMAVKAQAQRTQTQLQGQIDQLQRDGGATRAQLETLTAELQVAKETVQEVEQLRSQAAAAEQSRDQLNQRLATSLREDLVSKYGYKAEDVKDYKLEQLELLTEALAKAPSGGQSRSNQPRFNSGTNGGSGSQPATARAKILSAFESGEVRTVRGGNQGGAKSE